MKTDLKTGLKFNQFMLLKPFNSMNTGAYTGGCFESKSMDQMSEMLIESPYATVTLRWTK